MKKLISRITIALFLTLLACYPVHVMADEKDEGRYKGFDSATESGTHSIFILDSKTGELRWCYANRGRDEMLGGCKIMKVKK